MISICLLLVIVNGSYSSAQYVLSDWATTVVVFGNLKVGQANDSIVRRFRLLNNDRCRAIEDRLVRLPIDRCKKTTIIVGVESDSAGKTLDAFVFEGGGYPRIDTMIRKIFKEELGDWIEMPYDTVHHAFRAKLMFVLLNTYAYVELTYSKEDLQNSIEDRCKDANFYYNNATNYLKDGNYKRAISEFNTALTRNHFDSDALFNLAVAYFKTGQPKEACRCLSQADSYGDDRSGEAYQKFCIDSK